MLQIRILEAALKSEDTKAVWGLPALPRHLRRFALTKLEGGSKDQTQSDSIHVTWL